MAGVSPPRRPQASAPVSERKSTTPEDVTCVGRGDADSPLGTTTSRPRRVDDRAVAELVGYILGVAVFIGVIIGLSGVFTVAIESQAAVNTERQLNEPAEQLARSIEAVDRQSRLSDANGPFVREVSLPDRINGRQYTVRVYSPADAADSDVPCESPPAGDSQGVGCVVFVTDIGVTEQRGQIAGYYAVGQSPSRSDPVVVTTTVQGGDLRIVYPEGSGQIEITEADR